MGDAPRGFRGEIAPGPWFPGRLATPKRFTVVDRTAPASLAEIDEGVHHRGELGPRREGLDVGILLDPRGELGVGVDRLTQQDDSAAERIAGQPVAIGRCQFLIGADPGDQPGEDPRGVEVGLSPGGVRDRGGHLEDEVHRVLIGAERQVDLDQGEQVATEQGARIVAILAELHGPGLLRDGALQQGLGLGGLAVVGQELAVRARTSPSWL